METPPPDEPLPLDPPKFPENTLAWDNIFCEVVLVLHSYVPEHLLKHHIRPRTYVVTFDINREPGSPVNNHNSFSCMDWELEPWQEPVFEEGHIETVVESEHSFLRSAIQSVYNVGLRRRRQ